MSNEPPRPADATGAAGTAGAAAASRSRTSGQTPPAPPTRSAPPSDAVVGKGEFRGTADRRNGLITGIKSFSVKKVRYSNVKGLGIFEGDINLGPVEQLMKTQSAADAIGVAPRLAASGSGTPPANVQFAVAITGQRYRWPKGLIPYEVQPDIQATVDAAIQHWQERTPIRFVLRTPTNAAMYPNYVTFEVRDGCYSAVGMQGGSQVISIGLGCGIGQAIHEIGHAVGLWHEQSREDRDQFVRIAWENILPNMEHNFDQHIADGDDIGPYDYGSVMHYPAKAFSSNGLDTIVALGGQAIGQRDGLSDNDVAAVRDLYPDVAAGVASGARHLYTSLLLELARAIGTQGYRSEGVTFYGWPAPVPGTVPLLRLTEQGGTQIYTTKSDEAAAAISKGFAVDGVPCYVFASSAFGLTPLMRFDHAENKDSLFTTSLVDAQQAVTRGYANGGVAGYVLAAYSIGTVPVYRLSKAA